MIGRLFALLLLLFATPAAAKTDLSGTWAMRADGVAIFLLEVHHDASGWSAIWVRPAKWAIRGNDFADIAGPVERRASFAGRETDEGIELSFVDPAPNSIPDILLLLPGKDGHASLTHEALQIEPFDLVRTSADTRIGPWVVNAVYHRRIDRPTNAEMTALFDADQDLRKNWAAADHAKILKDDTDRRARTQALIDAGALSSGDDYYHAAFIFQHGGKPEDYLKAHLLAMIAIARGRGDATWIASATLDRYLQAIKQPQVTGTQYLRSNDQPWTQEPYDRALLSDPLRKALGVPPIAEQERRLSVMQAGNDKKAP